MGRDVPFRYKNICHSSFHIIQKHASLGYGNLNWMVRDQRTTLNLSPRSGRRFPVRVLGGHGGRPDQGCAVDGKGRPRHHDTTVSPFTSAVDRKLIFLLATDFISGTSSLRSSSFAGSP